MHQPNRRQALSTLGAVGASFLILPGFRYPKNGRDAQAFLRAVREGAEESVRRMLAEHPGLARATDEAGRSAFVVAHLADQAPIAEILRATGLELDLVESVLAEDWVRMEALSKAHPASVHAVHPIGGTPLYAHALMGSLDGWRLRSLGCAPDAAPAGGSGFSAARGAMDSPRVTWSRMAAKDLLSNGADANAPQKGGDTVLHGAVRRRDEALLRLVIRKGARVDAVDATGRSARALALEIGWNEGAQLLANHAKLPRDHRASRFALDADRDPIEFPDMADVPQELQSQTTGSSHMRLEKVKELVSQDPRLVFSISTDDELAIEASAHMGNEPLMRYHLDHGAPLSLPTAVSLGDKESIDFWLKKDANLIHERGAHDFPVMTYVAHGPGSVEIAEQLAQYGVDVDQHSNGTTTLHWCVMRGRRDLAQWLIEKGADVEAIAYQWDRDGQTPLQVAASRGRADMAKLLKDAGAKG